jgi:SAM-dependent methyltransferase
MLTFARYRCERHGVSVRTIDLKRILPARAAYDAVLCFDVLEHIPDPIATVRVLRDALRPGGLLFLHAPFGEDPDRPMHVVHRDVVSPRMRSLCFHSRWDLEQRFPRDMWAPRVFERVTPRAVDRVGYFLQDVSLPAALGAPLAAVYRAIVPRRAARN